MSMEHVPPALMFKGFSCIPITVPSCNEHNSAKSHLDQAIVSAFIIPLFNGMDHYSLEDDVKKAINEAKAHFQYVKKLAYSSQVISDLSDEIKLPEVSYLKVDLTVWMRQITAALIYDASQAFDTTVTWENLPAWSNEWIPTLSKLSIEDFVTLSKTRETAKMVLENLDWHEGWSTKNPYPKDIFYFQIYFEREEVLFRYSFYNRYVWYVAVTPMDQTLIKLKTKVGFEI
jgi:hypothetical protein